MAWNVQNPDALQSQMAFELYNKTPANLFPGPVGQWGIDPTVWTALIALTRQRCTALGIPQITGSLKGLCIWGSVIAAKFYTLKFAHTSRVIRVKASEGGDHYFVVIRNTPKPVIADITCNQFNPAPDYYTGTLSDIKAGSHAVKIAGGGSLYEAYAAGVASGTFVL